MIVSVFWPPPRDVAGAVKLGAVLLGTAILFHACIGGEACGLAPASPGDGDALAALLVIVPLAIVGYVWIQRRLRGDRHERNRTFALPRHRALPLPPGDDDAEA